MRIARYITLLALVVAMVAVAAPGASAKRAPHFEGTVVSVDRAAKSFRLRDAERGIVTIKVTSSTRYARISGFRALKPGLRRVEATVRRSGGAWVASKVQRN